MLATLYNNHVNVVHLLLKHDKVRVNQKGQGGETPIMLASDMGHTDVVREFVKHDKIDVNSKSDIGKTALSWQVRKAM